MTIHEYLDTLALARRRDESERLTAFAATPPDRAAEPREIAEGPPIGDSNAAVNVGSFLSFVDGLDGLEKEDVLYSHQLAQRVANNETDRFSGSQAWYEKYVEVLENLGWLMEQFSFTLYKEAAGKLHMDTAALNLIAAIATQNQLAVLTQGLEALEKLGNDDDRLKLFDFESTVEIGGNFQLAAVEKSENGAISMAMGAFHFRSVDARRRFLFISWGKWEVNLWTSVQRLTLNKSIFERVRSSVKQKLGTSATDFIKTLKIS